MIKDLLDQISKEKLAHRVSFHFMGEPTIHKHFDSAVKYADNLGLEIDLATNASNLNNERIEKLLLIKNVDIKISLRTLDEKVFSEHSCNMNFKQYLANIKNLIIKNIQNNSPAKITLKVFKRTFYSRIFTRRLKYSKYIKLKHLENLVKEISDELNIPTSFQAKNSFFSINERTEIFKNTFIRYDMLSIWDSEELKSNKYYNAIIGNCDGLRNHFVVLCNGDVIPCCRDYDGTIVLGNVTNQSLRDILLGDKAKYIRSSLDKYRLPTTYCKRCKGGPTILTSLINQIGSLYIYRERKK